MNYSDDAAAASRVDSLEKLQRDRRPALERLLSEAVPKHQAQTDQGIGPFRKILVILSAPRSGSSLLYWALSRVPGLRCLSGELTPFYRISGAVPLTDVHDGHHTGNATPGGAIEALRREVLLEALAGSGTDNLNHAAALFALRLQLQWPGLEIDLNLETALARTFLEGALGQSSLGTLTWHKYLETLSHRLPISTRYYDGQSGPQDILDLAPPCDDFVVEEPPFVLPRLGKSLGSDPAKEWLVVKTSTDTSRVEWLPQIFGDSEIRYLFLTRNPAASINGLVDGWHHPGGFFSDNVAHLIAGGLDIGGYSDRGYWGRNWWKFDRPKGWEALRGADILSVAAFQWAATNENAANALSRLSLRHLQVTFEDMMASTTGLRETVGKVANWLGVHPDLSKFPDTVPAVQATSVPARSRWKKRETAILEHCRSISETAASLDYNLTGADGWP